MYYLTKGKAPLSGIGKSRVGFLIQKGELEMPEDLINKLRGMHKSWSDYEECAGKESAWSQAADEITRLRKIEAAAVELLAQPQWNSDAFYDLALALDVALKEG